MDRPPAIVLPVGRPLTTAQAALVRLLAEVAVSDLLAEEALSEDTAATEGGPRT